MGTLSDRGDTLRPLRHSQTQPGQCCRAASLLRAGRSAARHQRASFLFHLALAGLGWSLCPVCYKEMEAKQRGNSNHKCKRLGDVSCVEGWNSLFELEKKTQCKDSATVFEFPNTFAKMTVNTCPVTTNDGTKSNLLQCN